jgi:hypothetical protein
MQTVMRAWLRALFSAGSSNAMSKAMMDITTSNSMSVKAVVACRLKNEGGRFTTGVPVEPLT